MDTIREELNDKIELLSEAGLRELVHYASFLKNKDEEVASLLSFFEHVKIYALHDLEQLRIKANYDDSGYGRFTVSIAQSIFSLLDLFGFLISESNRLEDTGRNIGVALQIFFSGDIKSHERGILIDIYRNRIMHSYFPKMCSIRNDDDELILIQNGDVWDLNVHSFSKKLVNIVNAYIQSAQKDSVKLFPLTQRYSKLIYYQEKSFEKHNSNLSKYYTPQPEITTTLLPRDTPPPVCYSKTK